MTPSPKLTSKDFVVLETYANGSVPVQFQNDDLHCYFRGNGSAVSTCQGVVRSKLKYKNKSCLILLGGLKNGVVHSDAHHYYTIRPLPTRFHDATSIPHVLSQKPHVVFKDVRFRSVEHCQAKIEDSKSKTPKKVTRSKREAFPVGSTVFVETAVFVDRDLFELMKSNFPVDTEREIIRFVLAMINAVS